ncbi:hypothetical protein BRARA_B00273 [Brassica rapa]|uniref:Uncharacterized protein n=1 Tax=Brassica campestris TaxID=3711 RepID=A0A398ACV4_BRACM|nr:hypothetical protein BRARA_B00273 [Brassica rapa]
MKLHNIKRLTNKYSLVELNFHTSHTNNVKNLMKMQNKISEIRKREHHSPHLFCLQGRKKPITITEPSQKPGCTKTFQSEFDSC